MPDLEAIWIEVTSISQRLLVGCVYRPSGDRTDFFGKFFCVVEKMWLSRKNVLIAGDFDVEQLSSNCNGSKLKRIYQAFITPLKNCCVVEYPSGFDLNKSVDLHKSLDFQIWGAYHLTENFANSRWKVNGNSNRKLRSTF